MVYLALAGRKAFSFLRPCPPLSRSDSFHCDGLSELEHVESLHVECIILINHEWIFASAVAENLLGGEETRSDCLLHCLCIG